ncbi:hypothetical protein A0H81_04446 [Grifola frondosa]|uniref:Bifunctional epoxide hydrolase 2 n=1 Tax=Grifola frondosa TaxID=5627 RepID=A0A1C7MHT8_GRIFR|nr:hypothetical protein A0H81_04446 [Grifola frondosa]
MVSRTTTSTVPCEYTGIAIALDDRDAPPHRAIRTARGSHGAWQKFERGEISLFPFYAQFGRELSDAKFNNVAYAQYCKRRGIAAGRWRIIALTNNFSKSDADIVGETAPSPEQFPGFSIESELAFLGWTDGATPLRLRAMFDDFCDSSTLGMRKPESGIYLLACSRNGIQPTEAVFLDDLGMNLKAAQALGMDTIHVPIGGSSGALKKLEEKLGIDLTSGFEPTEWTPSKL